MRFLKPIGTDCADAVQLAGVSAADSACTGKWTYRFRPDSWLPTADANLLLCQRASLEAKKRNYTAAIVLLNKLVAYDADNAEHYANRGLMHYHVRQWAQALCDYNRAIELDPALDKTFNNRANLHARQANWIDAIADYDTAIDLNPLNIRARLNQGITFCEMCDYDAAIDCLDIALFFRPNSASLYAERGRVYHLQGDWNCAIADYTRATQLTRNLDSSDFTAPSLVSRRVRQWMNSLIHTIS
ncbi:MAG: tetratricopeptide repeat protein [Phormidesmis sp.]